MSAAVEWDIFHNSGGPAAGKSSGPAGSSAAAPAGSDPGAPADAPQAAAGAGEAAAASDDEDGWMAALEAPGEGGGDGSGVAELEESPWDAGLDEEPEADASEAGRDSEGEPSNAVDDVPVLLVNAASFVADAPEATRGDAAVALALVWASLTGISPAEAEAAVFPALGRKPRSRKPHAAAASAGGGGGDEGSDGSDAEEGDCPAEHEEDGAPGDEKIAQQVTPAQPCLPTSAGLCPMPPRLSSAASVEFCVKAESLLAEGRAWHSTATSAAEDAAEALRLVPDSQWLPLPYPASLGGIPTHLLWTAVSAKSPAPAAERVLQRIRECNRDVLWKARAASLVRSLALEAVEAAEARGSAAEAAVRAARARADAVRRAAVALEAEEEASAVAEEAAEERAAKREAEADADAASSDSDDSTGLADGTGSPAASRRKARRRSRRRLAALDREAARADATAASAVQAATIAIALAAEATVEAWRAGPHGRCAVTAQDEYAAEAMASRIVVGAAGAGIEAARPTEAQVAGWVRRAGGGAAWLFAPVGDAAASEAERAPLRAAVAGAEALATERLQLMAGSDAAAVIDAADAGVAATVAAASLLLRGPAAAAAATGAAASSPESRPPAPRSPPSTGPAAGAASAAGRSGAAAEKRRRARAALERVRRAAASDDAAATGEAAGSPLASVASGKGGGASADPSPLASLLAVTLHRHPLLHPQPGVVTSGPGCPPAPRSGTGAVMAAIDERDAVGGSNQVVRALVSGGLGSWALRELRAVEAQWATELGPVPAGKRAGASGTGVPLAGGALGMAKGFGDPSDGRTAAPSPSAAPATSRHSRHSGSSRHGSGAAAASAGGAPAGARVSPPPLPAWLAKSHPPQ